MKIIYTTTKSRLFLYLQNYILNHKDKFLLVVYQVMKLIYVEKFYPINK